MKYNWLSFSSQISWYFILMVWISSSCCWKYQSSDHFRSCLYFVTWGPATLVAPSPWFDRSVIECWGGNIRLLSNILSVWLHPDFVIACLSSPPPPLVSVQSQVIVVVNTILYRNTKLEGHILLRNCILFDCWVLNTVQISFYPLAAA